MKILKINIRVIGEKASIDIIESEAIERKKTFNAPGFPYKNRIRKDEIMQIQRGGLRNNAAPSGVCLDYNIYCMADQKEQAIKKLREKMHTTLSEIRLELDLSEKAFETINKQ